MNLFQYLHNLIFTGMFSNLINVVIMEENFKFIK